MELKASTDGVLALQHPGPQVHAVSSCRETYMNPQRDTWAAMHNLDTTYLRRSEHTHLQSSEQSQSETECWAVHRKTPPTSPS